MPPKQQKWFTSHRLARSKCSLLFSRVASSLICNIFFYPGFYLKFHTCKSGSPKLFLWSGTNLVTPTIGFDCMHFYPSCQIEVSRRVTLEELPPVLVLHLKRFVFEKTGGCQKLNKIIEYPVDLEISKGTSVLKERRPNKTLIVSFIWQMSQ